MVPGKGGFTGLSLRDRHAMLLREACERLAGAGIVDPAARDNDRSFPPLERVHEPSKFFSVGLRPRNVPNAFLKKARRPIIGFCLNVLTEGEGDWPACGRIDHCLQGPRQGH
jgi:hypothetical protein